MTRIPYQIQCLQSGTDLKQVLRAGRTDVSKDHYDPETMEIHYPEKKSPSLQKQIVFWNVITLGYEIGDPIVHVSPEVQQYLGDNAIWTDSVTGLKGEPVDLMAFNHERELYNNGPLAVAGFKGIVERIGEYDIIHGLTGWHQQQITEARYSKPESLLIYYGYLNAFNSDTNTNNNWDNQLVAKEFSKYNILVFGNTVASPVHPDYANAQIIVARIKQLNPATQIFGYVDTTKTQENFETDVDDWVDLGATGIFMDRAGYDFGIDRADFNARVNYVHGEGLNVIANCWNQDNVYGLAEDPIYPNATFNPSELDSSLTHLDYYLLESAPINTDAYTGTEGYQSASDWAVRGAKAIGHRGANGPRVAACGIIDDNHTSGQDLFNFGFIAAYMFSLEAFGTSHSLYGASLPYSKWWNRPSVFGLGNCSWLNPSVQVDNPDTDVWLRFTQFGRLWVDFSSGEQLSGIETW